MSASKEQVSLINFIIQTCNRIYYTVAENFFYLIMAFAAPLFLYYVSQGKEVGLCLLNPQEGVNIGLILVRFCVEALFDQVKV